MSLPDTNRILRAYLAADAGLIAIVGDRIFCPHLPENTALPALGFFTRGGRSTPYIPDLPSPSVQFDCWGRTPQEARKVYRALYDVLQGIQNVNLSVPPTYEVSKGYTGTAFGEIQTLIQWNGKLYASVCFNDAPTEIWVYDGTAWTLDFTGLFTESIWQAIEFGNKLIWTAGTGAFPNRVLVFDGAAYAYKTTSNPTASASNQLAVLGGELYVFNRVGEGSKTSDLNIWTSIADAPDGFIIYGAAVLNGVLYIGTGKTGTWDDGHLYRYDPIGDTWTNIPLPITAAFSLDGLVTFDGKLYAAIRIGGVDGGGWIYSWDGTTWELVIDISALNLHTGHWLIKDGWLIGTLQAGAIVGSVGGLVRITEGVARVESFAKAVVSIAEYGDRLFIGTRRETGFKATIYREVFTNSILSAIEEVQGQDLADEIQGYYRVLTFFEFIIR